MDSTYQDALELAETAVQSAQTVMEHVGPERDGPCPCEGWTVATLVDKMVTSHLLMTCIMRGEAPGPELDILFPKQVAGDDPGASHAAAAADFFTAFRANDPDAQAPGPLGAPMGMTDQANLRAMDSTLNTWDLAEALGVDHGIGTDQAERVLAFATDFVPRVRATDAGGHTRFAEAAVEPTGDPLTDLILLSGRRLDWC